MTGYISGMQNERVIDLTRQELLDLVWSKPMRDVAPELGVSDTGLKKICQRHHVPRPPRGYFLMRDDRKPEKPDLPANDDARLESVRFFHGRREERSEEAIPPDIQELIDAETSPEQRISVLERLTRPHPLVAALLRELMGQETSRYNPMLVSPRGRLRVRVSKSSVARAMRILDALVKAAEARGFRVVEQGGYKNETVLELCGETVSFRLSEKLRRTERAVDEDGRGGYAWNRYDYEPSGNLQLEIDEYCSGLSRRRWRDGRRGKVEDSLNQFFVAALEAAASIRKRNERWAAQERERERRAEERAERERRAQEEQGRVDALVEAVEAWHLARRVREYVKVVAANGTVLTADWARWALEQADRFDPTTPSPPSILDEREEGHNEPRGWWETSLGL